MGCFLACFGMSKKHRKHKKHSNRALVKDIIRGSYEPLESSVPLNLNITENPIGSDIEFRDKPKSQLRSNIRKKVSFYLNVQVYEPISTDYHLLKYDTEEEHNESIKETSKNAASCSSFAGCNYRYQNWLDSYDEDDDIAYETVSLDDENSAEDSDDGGNVNEDDFSVKSNCDSNDGKSGSHVSDGHNNKRQHSVLSPIENITQWRAAKARRKEPPEPQRKENIAVEKELPLHLSTISNAKISKLSVKSNANWFKPKTDDVAVDASLSNWLVRPYTNQFVSLDNKSKTGIEAILSERSSTYKSNFLRDED